MKKSSALQGAYNNFDDNEKKLLRIFTINYFMSIIRKTKWFRYLFLNNYMNATFILGLKLDSLVHYM